MAPKQTAVLVRSYENAQTFDNLDVAEIDRPSAGPGEVLVNVRLRPVNPADVLSVRGVYPGFAPKSLPGVPGLEGMGTVAQQGEGANKFQQGQRVVGVPYPTKEGRGTYQEFVAVSEKNLLAVPDGNKDEDAAQFMVNPLTAYGFLDMLQIPQGEWLQQGAAGSSLGRMVIGLCKEKGIKTVNIVRSDKHVDELKSLGADEVIVDSEYGEKMVRQVKEVTGGKGAHGTIDPIAGKATRALLKATRNGGMHLIYGVLGGVTFEGEVPSLLFENKTLRGFWLSVWLGTKTVEQVQQIYQDVWRLMAKGVLRGPIGEVYPLSRVKEAMKESERPGKHGKPMLRND